MYRNFIRDNVTLVAIILFITIFSMIQLSKPAFLYNTDGSIREFGVGYKNKTILPIWLLSIFLGIVCYLIVMYYIANPKFF
jgi:cytochrome b subunit of formate dehydrogenase